MKTGPLRGNFSRSRSLEYMDDLFFPHRIESIVEEMISKSKNTHNIRCLEVGCGEGRVLMQLRKLFPIIQLHGINKNPWQAMEGEESLKETGIRYGIFSEKEITNVNLPKIHFLDASKMEFENNYFDLIISQVAIPYIERKDFFLQEAWRVLKLGGKALLHIDTYNENLPDYMQYETPRFIIQKANKIYPLRQMVNNLRKSGYNIHYGSRTMMDPVYSSKYKNGKYIPRTQSVIVMEKNTNKKLKLGLIYDEVSSLDLNHLKEEKGENAPGVFWGHRSVYRI